MNIKKLFKDWRIIMLIFFLILSFIAINHQFSVQGIEIKSVEQNSPAKLAGIQSPSADTQPTKREIIYTVNNKEVNTLQDYNKLISETQSNSTIRIKTNNDEYIFLKTSDNIGLTVGERSTSNLRKGLDLQGGTRVLLKPVTEVTDQEIKDVMDTMENRLNVYGLSDLKIRSATDFSGNKYVVIEIAGATKEEVKELIGSQGKFEAKIGEETVFEGGKKDIVFVCRNDGTCSGVTACSKAESGYSCRFEFAITLSPEAAKKQAEASGKLDVNTSESGQRYLSKTLDLYLDGVQVDSLQIGEDLKGQETTRISISGPGYGITEQDALKDGIHNMNKLQTVLITGSLPTKLEIIKFDSISPSLGKSIINNILFVSIIAALAVALIIYIRYRSLKISIPVIITLLSEIYIVLGLAALFKYNLDLAAIAGLIASVGTGVDDQIVIADEVLNEEETSANWKEHIKKAFFVIMAAYFTTVAAMLPLLKAGAGLLTGFALVTIAGVTIGVFITRPAFASIIKNLLEE